MPSSAFLTLGTALHVLISMSHQVLEHMPTHPHEKHTSARMYLCKIFPGTVRRCGVKSYTRSLCLCTSWFCTLFSRPPSTASLSHRVPASLFPPSLTSLPDSHLPLLISFLLIFFHSASHSLTVNFKSWYWLSVVQVQRLEGVWVSFLSL